MVHSPTGSEFHMIPPVVGQRPKTMSVPGNLDAWPHSQDGVASPSKSTDGAQSIPAVVHLVATVGRQSSAWQPSSSSFLFLLVLDDFGTR